MKSSIIEIEMTYSEYQNAYSFGARCNMRIFSWLFPGVLKIILLKD